MATFIHATHVRNLPSILKRGLDPGKATRRRKAVWLASETEERWAVNHVLVNQGARLEDVAILVIDLPVDWVRGHRYGLWYCCRRIPATCVRKVRRFVPMETVL
jgi:RNA:NAD 2'-phosphotransferase (TPT1/KptA family)